MHKKPSSLVGCKDKRKLPLGARCGLLHPRVKKGITEEVQRATENNSGIISGLEASNQEGVLANSVRVLVRLKKGITQESSNLHCISCGSLKQLLKMHLFWELCTALYAST